MIVPGKELAFSMTMVMIGSVLLGLILIKWKKPTIRKIPALEVTEEAVSRATEMGKPVLFTTSGGGGGLHSSEFGAGHLAGLQILSRIARSCAKQGANLVCLFRWPEEVPVAQAIVNYAYRAEGQSESYNEENIRFVAGDQQAFAAGIIGFLEKERPATFFVIGPIWAEGLNLLGTGREVGCFQIGGSTTWGNSHEVVASCDYFYIGEEIYAASAQVSEDPRQQGAIWGEDFAKWISMTLAIVGVILTTIGIKFIS